MGRSPARQGGFCLRTTFRLPIEGSSAAVDDLLRAGHVTVIRLPLDGGRGGSVEEATASVKAQLEDLLDLSMTLFSASSQSAGRRHLWRTVRRDADRRCGRHAQRIGAWPSPDRVDIAHRADAGRGRDRPLFGSGPATWEARRTRSGRSASVAPCSISRTSGPRSTARWWE